MADDPVVLPVDYLVGLVSVMAVEMLVADRAVGHEGAHQEGEDLAQGSHDVAIPKAAHIAWSSPVACTGTVSVIRYLIRSMRLASVCMEARIAFIMS
jgi:hypothetical protein